ncbi:MAG: 30S ribosome-binding factor RbfA [Parcubacteria group bacterium]|nr:30S ribosome-binding factor RbfA [Parcubacteria group bacterium]
MSQRTEQIAETLHRLIGEAFLRDLEFPEGTLATISEVDVAPDMKHAKVFVSVLPFDRTEFVMGFLIRHSKRIQQQINKQLTMKFAPRIHFEADARTEVASTIEQIIDAEAANRDDVESPSAPNEPIA